MDESTVFSGRWVIAICGGGKYVGKKASEDDDTVQLSPAYEVFHTMMGMQTPNGQVVHVPHLQVYPLLLSTGDVTITVRPEAMIAFDDLSSLDVENWRRMIMGAREIQTKERAARSGIELSTSMPKRH